MSGLDEERLSFRSGDFYGWTMYPGYAGRPYRSPIRVERIDARQEGVFELQFLNLFYAAGVQSMSYLLRPLRRETTYLIAEEVREGSATNRVIVAERLDKRWMEDNVPRQSARLTSLFDDDGKPLTEEFLTLAATAW